MYFTATDMQFLQNAQIYTSHSGTDQFIPCDVLSDRKAVLYDNFSGCNFCMEIVELFKKYNPSM